MVKKISKFQFELLVMFCLIGTIYFLSGCAAKGVPGGGPVDKTPPTIVSTFPSPDSTGIKALSVIKFEFSEAMNEGSIANAIFISPPLKFEAEWQSDSELEIVIKDSIKNDQTYVVVLGSNIRDLRNNKLSESFQLAFASGNKIDQGRIEGKVHDLERNQTLSIFAFKVSSDTMRFDNKIPDYISQTGDEGNFILNYLSNGNYRIFAVADQNNNLTIDSDFESLAIPHRDVVLDTMMQRFTGINLKPTRIDTLAPVLTNIRSISNRRIHLRLSEKVNIPAEKQLSVFDSLSAKKIDILAVSQNIEAENILELYTQPMDSGRIYQCRVSALTDSSGNVSIDTTYSFVSSAPAKPDTFKLITLLPADSAWNMYPIPEIYLETNQPLNKESVFNNFKIRFKSGRDVEGVYKFPTAYEAGFSPNNNLPLDSVFSINLDLSQIHNVWLDSLGDSLITRYFKINSGDDYGEISGKIIHPDTTNLMYNVKATKINGKDNYSQSIMGKKEFKLNYIPDGMYRMSVFQDKDSNAVYSPGNLYPFEFSEPFSVAGDTVKVRKRWESSGVNLYLPQ